MPRNLSATPSRRKISMERAPICPHFTFGGSLGGRRSATMTSMPRQAKSMASVSPTGPPPTISTLVLIPPIPRDGVYQLSLAWSGQTEKVPTLTTEWQELAHLGQLATTSLRQLPRKRTAVMG